MNHELELRGRLTEEAYRSAKQQLEQDCTPVGNNKTSQFFVFPRGILKVSEHENPAKSVLSVKIGDEAASNLEEHESEFKAGSYEQLVSFLRGLGYEPKEEVIQKRTDYKVDGCTISLKYTDSWGFHFEAEKMVDDSEDDSQAREELLALCTRYGLTPMSAEELAAFLKTL